MNLFEHENKLIIITGSSDKYIKTWEIDEQAENYIKLVEINGEKQGIAAIKILSCWIKLYFVIWVFCLYPLSNFLWNQFRKKLKNDSTLNTIQPIYIY